MFSLLLALRVIPRGAAQFVPIDDDVVVRCCALPGADRRQAVGRVEFGFERGRGEIDVSLDDFPVVCFSDGGAVYRGGCFAFECHFGVDGGRTAVERGENDWFGGIRWEEEVVVIGEMRVYYSAVRGEARFVISVLLHRSG